MNPLKSLLDRRSYSYSKLTYPGPSDEDLKQLFDLVMTTPDHGNLKPWRFVVARGEEKMNKLAEVTLAMYKRQSTNGELKDEAYRAVEYIKKLPMMLFVMTDVYPDHKVSLWDQYLSAGAATQNIMNGLHLQGYGGLWYTFLANDEVKPLLGLKAEDQVAAAIAIGTPKPEFVKKIKRQSPNDYCFEWQGLGVPPTKFFC